MVCRDYLAVSCGGVWGSSRTAEAQG